MYTPVNCTSAMISTTRTASDPQRDLRAPGQSESWAWAAAWPRATPRDRSQPDRLRVNVPARAGVPAAHVRQDRCAVDPRISMVAAAEVEAHVGAAGWDQRPTLFALVRAAQFAARRAGDRSAAGHRPRPMRRADPGRAGRAARGRLDEALARIGWPDSVAGCALSQEIVILPPSVDDARFADDAAAAHPQRREARLVVAVLRDGSSATLLRLRGDRRRAADRAGPGARTWSPRCSPPSTSG